jgi:WD repeat-containing protein 48
MLNIYMGSYFIQATHFRQSVQAHGDWVNDILLCNRNQTGMWKYFVSFVQLIGISSKVISASSDGTLKAWNPHAIALADPSTIGSHCDYVRCLAHWYGTGLRMPVRLQVTHVAISREQNWIASGSFDRTIKLWDLGSNTKSPLATLNLPDTSAPKSSIYALAVDPFGHIVTSGSPERVVRLWDPRTGKRIGELPNCKFVFD